MANKRITPRLIFDAMEKNDLPKVQGQLVERRNGAITGACAYGQAALHLNVDPDALYNAAVDSGIQALNDLVLTNDNTDSTVKAIARYYRTQVPYGSLDRTIAYLDERVPTA